MADRRNLRAELERKKIQLAQMKEERERRSRILREEGDKDRVDDADAVLRSLGLSPNISRTSTAPSNISLLDHSRSRDVDSPDIPQEQVQTQQSSASLDDSRQVRPAPQPLQVVHVNQISIPPKERVLYNKSTQTQTQASATQPQNDQTNSQGETSAPQQKSYYGKQTNSGQPVDSVLEWDDEFPVLTYPDDDEEKSSDFNNTPQPVPPQGTATIQIQTDEEEQEKASEIRMLSEDERNLYETREDYQHFVDHATKILERALFENENSEIFIQYFPEDGKDTIDVENGKENKLSLNKIFFDERWSSNRCVTDFDWSTQYPELLLASYSTNEQAPSDPDGTLLVWNMRFKNTSPEYVFHCQSPIVSCCFAKFHPSLIVGGTYSGQIVLWDTRSHKKTPVQRTPISATAHTHPIYCVKVIGSQNAHNLISISNDGKLCTWSLDMLSSPQDTLDVSQQRQNRTAAATCISFRPDDSNNLLVGAQDGSVYSTCRHGTKAGITSSFESHDGFVTAIDHQPINVHSGYSRLFLTSSIDWTVKLWDSKNSSPIHTFESNGDYVYDVKWSPTNPNLFASVDGDGRVDVWNWANDLELPTASAFIESRSALNKLIWTPNGNQVVVGDHLGRIHVYDVGDNKRSQSLA